ncbi:unnamed protein product [Thlaspi arvense]|uniref:Myb-like domain-containing protein n=1 Tax=Thlaspi arvense TaxID=13288 RepID=A0AAU9SN59_THLAR|nr:unnamed protein product [Thlaspi arvense]
MKFPKFIVARFRFGQFLKWKMAELGYIRNAKKCKEKFENVYKYHKRTKEGRTGKSEGKTYRFFDQLEALETQSTSSLHHQQQQQQPPQPQPLQTQSPLRPHNNHNSSLFSTPPPVTTIMPPIANISLPSSSIPPYTQPVNIPSFPNISGDFLSDNSMSSSSSYSTSSDVDIGGTTTTKKKRKRKWKEFFERLMKQVVDKQEELQRKFLEAVEKREHERMAREESWRVQEVARINREHEILAQERSMSAAKDAAVMAFLQKLSEKPNPQGQSVAPPQPQQARSQMQQLNNNNNQQTTQQQTPQTPQPPPPVPQPVIPTLDATKTDNGDQNMTPASAGAASSSRWPKVEIEALIKLRTNLDSKYQENGPKGPLWEEISAGMRRLGFNRNSKRCKEKWENINKYFKKVKESNKKRPEDSKTCPYFHQLDALYKERNKFHTNNIASSSSTSGLIKPDNSVPLMVQPEQQWPPATATTTSTTTVAAAAQTDQPHPHPPPPQPSDQNFDDEEGTDDEEYDDEEEDEENEEEEGGEFELVPNSNNKTTNNQ